MPAKSWLSDYWKQKRKLDEQAQAQKTMQPARDLRPGDLVLGIDQDFRERRPYHMPYPEVKAIDVDNDGQVILSLSLSSTGDHPEVVHERTVALDADCICIRKSDREHEDHETVSSETTVAS